MSDHTCELVLSFFYELLALGRVIKEAKFHIQPDNKTLMTNPHLAEVARAVSETYLTHVSEDEQRRIKKAEQLTPDRRQWHIVLFHMVHYARDQWFEASEDGRRQLVQIAFAPYTISDAFLALFIQEVDLTIQALT